MNKYIIFITSNIVALWIAIGAIPTSSLKLAYVYEFLVLVLYVYSMVYMLRYFSGTTRKMLPWCVLQITAPILTWLLLMLVASVTWK